MKKKHSFCLLAISSTLFFFVGVCCADSHFSLNTIGYLKSSMHGLYGYRGVVIVGDYAYATVRQTSLFSYNGYILTFNVSELRSSNSLLGNIDALKFTLPKGEVSTIARKGNYLYAGGKYLEVYDITDRENIKYVKYFYKNNGYKLASNSLKIIGNYLIATSSDSTLLFDISTPENPKYLSTISGYEQSNSTISGDYIYVSESKYYNRIHIYDIKNPYSPVQINVFDVEPNGYYGYMYHVDTVNDTLFSLFSYNDGSSSRLYSYSITDKEHPVYLDSIYLDVSGRALGLTKNIAIASDSKGILINVSNPKSLIKVVDIPYTSTTSDGFPYDVAIDGNLGLVVGYDFITGVKIESNVSQPNVVILLHGMNTTPNKTWKKFAKKYFSNRCIAIDNGTIASSFSPNSYGTRCYSVRFGAFDEDGPNGIENAKQYGKESNIDLAGDFSTLDQLGTEVQKAVSAILTKHPNAHITLLGHSRGGLAARAFLQNPDSSNLKSITSLITMGTPHSGSPLGRIYSYLSQNPRPQLIVSGDGGKTKRLAADWKIVDFLRGKKKCDFILLDGDKRLDVRRPTLNYIASGSDSMNALNENIGNLPTTVSYGAIVFEGNNIGYLGRISKKYIPDFKYSVFNQSSHPDICTVSLDAQNSILNNKSQDDTDYIGDGIVPSLNQMYNDATPISIDKDILHTEETSGLDNINDISYIEDMFCKLGLSDWITSCK